MMITGKATFPSESLGLALICHSGWLRCDRYTGKS